MIVTDALLSTLRKEFPGWEGTLPNYEPGFPEEWDEDDLRAWIESMDRVNRGRLSNATRNTTLVSMKENGNGRQPMGNGSKNPDTASWSAASDLIRTLDSAFSEMSSFAAMAAKDAEDARRNARAASELARLFSTTSVSNRKASAGIERKRQLPSMGATNSLPKTTDPKKEADKEALVCSTQEIRSLSNPLVNTPRQNGTEEKHQSRGGDAGGAAIMSGRKRKIKVPNRPLQPESSTERLARSHADDVLSLSLELERTKQALEREQNAHHQMKAALKETKSKNAELDAQVQKLLNDMETQREDDRRKVDGLQHQLGQAQIRVEAAEEDAQLALDLAKGNAEDREQIETWLQRSLQEVQVLRDQLEHVGVSPDSIAPSKSESSSGGQKASAKKRVVRFADTPTDSVPEASLPETPKAMVVAGKSLLVRRGGGMSTPDNTAEAKALHAITLTPEQSAERRRTLRKRVEELNENGLNSASSTTAIVQSQTPSLQDEIDIGYEAKAMEQSCSVIKLLRDSGKRIGLAGHWWTRNSHDEVDVNVEAMARQYCHSVEVKLDRQKGEMKELRALCDYLEHKLVSSSSTSFGG